MSKTRKDSKKNPDLQNIPVLNEIMFKIGIDLCNLPEIDEFKHLIYCTDYFSKW